MEENKLRVEDLAGKGSGDWTTITVTYAPDSVFRNSSGMGKEVVKESEKNPFVPKAIYANSKKRTVFVIWEDESETKVTCSYEDAFTVEAGFYAALTVKVFGNNKKLFKNKWWKIIERRVNLIGEEEYIAAGDLDESEAYFGNTQLSEIKLETKKADKKGKLPK